MTRKTTGRNPRTLVVHVVIECPNVASPESDRADWCMDEITDHLKRSGLTEQGFRWYIDDAHMKDGIPATVAVRIPHSDADTLADALARASERDDHLAKECENAEDPETAAGVRECVAAMDRLADAIAAAVRQEGND